MNQRIKKSNFKKFNSSNSNIKSSNLNKRNKQKEKIMDKFNLTSEEADRVLVEIEKKQDINRHTKKKNSDKQHNTEYDVDNRRQKQMMKNSKNVNDSQNVLNRKKKIINKKSNENHKSHANSNNKKNNNQEIHNNKNNSKDNQKVDVILEEILPNYNQQISIIVDHVDLTFEVQNEKIDTLKETIIRAFYGEKSKKIKIHALKDVSFQIYKGEKVGIIGYNGAGKSTLLNVITGIYPPDKGSVTTYGKISPLLSLGAGFDMNFSGRQNIILNGAVLGYDKKYLESKIEEIIEFSELGDFIDIPIKNYSAGMLAKLGFSIATSVNPDILIIDEILGVGDVNFQKKSSDKIRSLMDGGTTVVLVSHSIPQIRELCDKAIWIDDGKVKAIGEVNKVCEEYLKDAEKASNEQLANIELIK